MSDLDIGKIVHELRINCQHNEANLIEQQQQEIEEAQETNLQQSEYCNALAAHIERLEDEITGIINDSVGVSGYHMNGDIASWQEFDIGNILEQSPQTSLAEVRTQQAEESFIAGLLCGNPSAEGRITVAEAAKKHANKIRNGES